MSEWQPIETAPKDEVLLYQPAEPAVRYGRFRLPARILVGRASEQITRKATHWMPLPEPPWSPRHD